MALSRTEHVTCLGCGCGCDDITVSVSNGRITDADPVCPLGRAWFGDGTIPGEVLQSGRPGPFDQAIGEASELLTTAQGQSLVYLGSDLTSQSQRQAVALADLLGATVDTATSETAAAGLLVAQRRGRAGATLGEIRNRADVFLFWGVDPSQHYPRFMARYVEAPGTHVPGGRSGRTIIGISVGQDRAPRTADITLGLETGEEVAALSIMRASLQGRKLELSSPRLKELDPIIERLTRARYIALLHDAEPTAEPRNPLRVEGLIALAQALNGPTRAALVSLRAGGNRSGAESVLTWQTGYPLAVDYSRGHPRYVPGQRGLQRLSGGGFRAALIVGTPSFNDSVEGWFGGVSTVIIGPRASRSALEPRVAIDTGVAGIHESGTAYRMDEVPLRLRPPLQPPRSTSDVLRALTDAVGAALRQNRL
jgi:formylmethanofuran dehydrogenase subunit B